MCRKKCLWSPWQWLIYNWWPVKESVGGLLWAVGGRKVPLVFKNSFPLSEIILNWSRMHLNCLQMFFSLSSFHLSMPELLLLLCIAVPILTQDCQVTGTNEGLSYINGFNQRHGIGPSSFRVGGWLNSKSNKSLQKVEARLSLGLNALSQRPTQGQRNQTITKVFNQKFL